ncbi:hypothetical protein F2Q70_00025436 [Brassica cretica]|uniref:Uncharacterized protein n=1 Tax=Brassica cretica TaxID=69181 RepID=A0A8S9IFJ0_BRACR|nr:hypothetical protein F2Q68_00024835 [Brassica cretica]KAF2604190.1 hypothetical protein F2Q70_00025436 [Brassica cretica]
MQLKKRPPQPSPSITTTTRTAWRSKDDFTAKEKKNRDGLRSSSSAMTEEDQEVQ